MANITVPIVVNLPDDWVEQIINRLRSDPDADWVEVVRCKYCKHRPVFEDEELEFPDYICPCQCEDSYYSWYPKDDFYCQRGENK